MTVMVFPIARAQTPPSMPGPELLTALPDFRDLRGFRALTGYRFFPAETFVQVPYGTKVTAAGAEVCVERESDGLFLSVRIGVYATPAEAHATAQQAIRTQDPPPGKLPEGCPSGKALGEKRWQSRSPKATRPQRGTYYLIVVDGRATVAARLMRRIEKAEHGAPVFPEIAFRDLDFVELLVRQTLERLTVMGYTSRPAKQAAPWATKQVEERLRKAKANGK
jgi:hypothetical protein